METHVLAIETSCDETAAAVVEGRTIRSNVIASQREHRRWGGIVPEIASRAHLECIWNVVDCALIEACVELTHLDAIACTVQPGLVGSLLVGANFAKGLALQLELPCVPVHHLEGHLLSGYIAQKDLRLPAVVLVASGGHTVLYLLKQTSYQLLGSTRDDAAGETFDKVASMLGLPYPGGPALELLAKSGKQSIQFPRPLLEQTSYEFSFSGLKSAVRRYLLEHPLGSEQERADLAASVQQAIIDVLVQKTLLALQSTGASTVVLAGGVAANQALQEQMRQKAEKIGCAVIVPEIQYLQDNAAMIGLVAAIKLELHGADKYRRMDFEVDPAALRIHRHGKHKNSSYPVLTYSL